LLRRPLIVLGTVVRVGRPASIVSGGLVRTSTGVLCDGR
jgi:hypothetical protein